MSLTPEQQRQIPSAIFQHILDDSEPPWAEWKEHPDFSIKWVLQFIKRQKGISGRSLDLIAKDIDFLRHYSVILALVKHRSCPQVQLMRFIDVLRWGDLITCLRLSHIPVSVKAGIQRALMQRFPFLTLGEKIAIARKAPQILIPKLRLESEENVIRVLIDNPNFTHGDALFLCTYPSITSAVIDLLAGSQKWTCFKDIRLALLRNQKTPRARYLGLLAGLDRNELKSIERDPRVPLFAKILAKKLSN